ncbi:MAG: threonine--tRNA ligase [Phycisphaerales bacterium]|nr:MAG: threonine--tRNA ligase [Phycisphaerales bacterium]
MLRHSAAHVMAQAVCELFPETKLVYGPPVDKGFYYDLDLDRSITPDDFDAIGKAMQRIIAQDRPFRRYDLTRAEAMEKLEREGNRYKIDNAERAEGDTISFYVTGERTGEGFEDLCRGPHLPSTGRIGAFVIHQVSGSHYRGDISEKPLQRLYGTAFFKAKSLKEHLRQLEEAKARDHRVIGKELGLFSIDPEVGSGLVLWHPKGAVIRMLLENFLKFEMLLGGYQPVYSANIGRLGLYRTSGHYPYYRDSQFPPLYETDRGRTLLSLLHTIERAAEFGGARREKALADARALADAAQALWGDVAGLDDAKSPEQMIAILDRELRSEEGYLLKPMNCPHHVHIYKATPRSYRDLPIRYFEFGTVYRYEQSGELGGMVRVRGFTQDDAHLFCTPEQLRDELRSTIALTLKVLEAVDLTDYRVRIGLRDPDASKYTGSDDLWDQAQEQIRAAVRETGLDATEEKGEAAFYGPKIDFVVRDCIHREWQLGTIQVDYNLPERFDLTYIGRDNRPHRPIMIHRAPFGSIERFVAILTEHFAGAFPLWLAPIQVAVVTVSEKSAAYARQVYDRAAGEGGLRVELDVSSDKIGPKKHRYRALKVPYILVIGEQEAAEGTVNVNDRQGRTLGNFPLEKFLEGCQIEIATKGKKLSM